MAKIFIILGICFLIVGILWSIGAKIPGIRYLGHLPGDIIIERDSFRFYFPITSGLIVSVILTLLLRLIRFLFSTRG